MSAEPTTIPTKGLALGQRESGDDEQPARRTGDDLISAAADGAKLTGQESEDLLGYFLTNGGLPGDDEPHPVEWMVGEGKRARKNVWMVRTIQWEEWQDAVDRTTNDGQRDTLETASWIVARALVTPRLGPAVQRQQSEAAASADGKTDWKGERVAPPSDAAELLRRMFAKQSGVLLAISSEVLRLSKLSANVGGVRTLDEDVEAGKA